MKHVKGKNKGNVVVYALSTCGWCKKTKKLLNDLGVDYYYEDVDLLSGDERNKAMDEMKRISPSSGFPLIVIDGRKSISGYDEEKILKEIGNE